MATDTLKIMKEHVPKEWRVHVHCFTSSLDLAKSMLDEWPNLFIGYTGVCGFLHRLNQVPNRRNFVNANNASFLPHRR